MGGHAKYSLRIHSLILLLLRTRIESATTKDFTTTTSVTISTDVTTSVMIVTNVATFVTITTNVVVVEYQDSS